MAVDIKYSNILKISWPILVSGIATHIVGVTDTIFISNLGQNELGGAGNGLILYLVIFLVTMGFTLGLQIFIGRRNGEENYSAIGPLWSQALYFILGYSLVMFLLIKWSSAGLSQSLFHSVDVQKYATEFLEMRSWGIFFTALNLLFVAFYVGTARTNILAYFTPFTSGLNIFLDYALIYGKYGLPEMGVEGAALASNLSEAMGTLLFVIYSLNKIDLVKYGFIKLPKPSFTPIRKVFNIASPIMMQNLLSIGSWFLFFTMIEHLGEAQLALSHIVRSLYIFFMVPVMAFSDATNTMVSNLMGQKESNKVIPLVRKVSVLGAVLTLLLGVILYFIPQEMIGFYTDDPTLIAMALPSYKVITFAFIPFGLAMIAFKGVTGTGNTRTTFVIETTTIILYLAYAYYTAKILGGPVELVWTSELLYGIALTIMCWGYLLKGNWSKKEI